MRFHTHSIFLIAKNDLKGNLCMRNQTNRINQECIQFHWVYILWYMLYISEDLNNRITCKGLNIFSNISFSLSSDSYLLDILYNYHSSILHTFLGISGIVALNRIWRAKILFCSPNICRFGLDHKHCNQEDSWHKFHLRRQRIRTDRLCRQCCWSSNHSFQGKKCRFFLFSFLCYC